MKYGISQQGVTSLRKLATDMSKLNDDIESNGITLETTVVGLGEGLGVYGDQILDIIKKVNGVQEKGRESVDQLTAKVNKLADQVEALVNSSI
jgi:hypothetical protein